MMPEWHQLDSSCTMSEQQESVKKKTLKSSSRSFLFSTGLYQHKFNLIIPPYITFTILNDLMDQKDNSMVM